MIINVNVIFDLGGVVLKWTPELIIKQFFHDKDNHKQIMNDIIKHEDWNEFDRGSLEKEILLQRIFARTGITPERGEQFLTRIWESLEPIPGTLELIYQLKARGIPLFCLSNISWLALNYLEKTYKFWDAFRGCVFSCKIKLIKPEEGIYKYLFDKYDLNPKDCIFVDDLEQNLKAAARLGVTTHLFKTPAKCAAEINRILSDVRSDKNSR